MAQRRSRGSRKDGAQERAFLIDDSMKEQRARRSHRRRRKSGAVPVVLSLLALFLAAAFLFGGRIIEAYLPSSEQKDLNEWFEVSGTQVKVYLNDAVQQDTYGEALDGEVYLPIAWVNENLNKRFFWSASEKLLTYTLPDEVIDLREEDRLSDGNPVFLLRDGGMYLSLSKIQEYTDVNSSVFAADDVPAKRVFLYKGAFEVQRAKLKHNAKLRTKGGIKAPILTELTKAGEVTVLDTMDKWSKVSTENGFIGYIQNRMLAAPETYSYPHTYTDPEAAHHLLDEKVVLGWHQVSGKAGNATLTAYAANTDGVMNVISPTWIQIKSADGAYDNFAAKEYVEEAHAAGLKVWPAVDNFNHPTGLKEFSTKDYFALSTNRRDFIDRLIADAGTYGYDGLNLDFESLPRDAGPSYVQFYRELSVACRKAGLVLSIDNYVPYHFNDHYDLEEQGYFADYVVIMGYDEHTNGSEEAGSVASIGYTRMGIEETLKSVPAERIINGVPFFTRLWKEKGASLTSSAMGMREAAQYIEAQGIELNWDAECGQYYGEKEIGGANCKIWMEDARSIGEKMDVIREHGLGGAAAWRLNFEPREIWAEMNLNQ